MQPTDGSKKASQSHGETSRHGLQLLLETEKIALKSDLQKDVASMDQPQVRRQQIFKDLDTNRTDPKRVGGLIRASSMKKLTTNKTHLSRYAGIQGSDGFKMLTNTCTQSASIVPGAYYAHVAASSARSYMEGDLSDSDSHGPRAKGTGLLKYVPFQ
ncbi:PAZ domain-containing protein [Artemisia annua]|uniref:PAZ domain-containing protein n=1 Tax=Artemisia annua TaxID=35608 RepID=A0A2U1QML5_ARTAN|nr:PAZ domain-containing protein [Artemisia annua]